MSIDKNLLEILNTQNACSVYFQSERFMIIFNKILLASTTSESLLPSLQQYARLSSGLLKPVAKLSLISQRPDNTLKPTKCIHSIIHN